MLTLVPTLPRLRAVRVARALSQEELAHLAGVSRVAITRLERGDIDARYLTIRRLAEALRVEPSDLMGMHMMISRRVSREVGELLEQVLTTLAEAQYGPREQATVALHEAVRLGTLLEEQIASEQTSGSPGSFVAKELDDFKKITEDIRVCADGPQEAVIRGLAERVQRFMR